MAKNFYNLPPSWNPGYAMPESVMDEGLERRAFVTAMLPRGTYDDSTGLGGGYATPEYIDDEVPGQGARTTKWLARGYYGPNLPAWLDQKFSQIVGEQPASGRGVVLDMKTMAGLGGTDAYHAAPSGAQRLGPWVQYGRRSAAIMIDQAKRLPPQQREPALKAMMTIIDPSLVSRARALGDQAKRQGATPQAALAHGIAAAMTEGMLGEVFELGRTGRRPKARSRIGLGCYGCAAALGDAVSDRLASVTANAVRASITPTPAQQQAIDSALMQQFDIPPVIDVGPWSISATSRAPTTFIVKQLTAAQQKSIGQMLVKAMAQWGVSGGNLSNPGLFTDLGKLGWPNSSGSRLPTDVLTGSAALAKFKHPETGNQCVLAMKVGGSKDNPTFTLWWSEDKSLLAALIELPAKLTRAAIDSIKTAIDGVSEVGCKVVNQPGASTAAGVVGGVYGGPAGAAVGVKGTEMAKDGCNAGTATPPPPVADSGLMVPLLVLGGGAALVLLLNKKKKAS